MLEPGRPWAGHSPLQASGLLCGVRIVAVVPPHWGSGGLEEAEQVFLFPAQCELSKGLSL